MRVFCAAFCLMLSAAAPVSALQWRGTVFDPTTPYSGSGGVVVVRGRFLDANSLQARWRCRGAGCPRHGGKLFLHCFRGGVVGVIGNGLKTYRCDVDGGSCRDGDGLRTIAASYRCLTPKGRRAGTLSLDRIR